MNNMNPFEDRLFKLKLVLDETQTFPMNYLFKFIVPLSEIHHILLILDGMEIEQKASSKGNYISVSGRLMAYSSDDIIKIYRRASQIKGVISL
jgi:putative lipoic acid-binding regulatory protein